MPFVWLFDRHIITLLIVFVKFVILYVIYYHSLDYMEQIMNEENDWDHNVEGDAVEGPIVCVSRQDVLLALDEMKTGNACGPSELSLELIAARGGVGIQVMAVICHKVLDRFGMPAMWALGIVVSFFKVKGDIRNCSCYGVVRHLEHGMKGVERVLQQRLCRIVTFDELQFCFMCESGTIDVVFILRGLKEEHHAKGKKLCVYFVDLEKAFDRVPRQVL